MESVMRQPFDTFTPGPWKLDLSPEIGVFIVSETTEEPVAALGGADEVGIGDATLILLSPELLAVARQTREVLAQGLAFNDNPSDAGLQELLRAENDLRIRLDEVLAKADPLIERSLTESQRR